MCAHFCCTHISRILFAFDAHSRTSHAHLKEDDGGLEAEELPEEVVEVLNKVNLKVEHFDINKSLMLMTLLRLKINRSTSSSRR